MNEHETLEAIWGYRLLDEGFLGIPNIIVRNYRKLNIEHGEFGLICAILTYKHDTKDPYPSHETLAEHLQCSTRQIRKWVDSLEEKKLLLIGRRKNAKSKQFGSMVYNFRPLIEAALHLIGGQSRLDIQDDWDVIYNEPVEPKVPEEPQVPLEPEVPVDREPQVPLNRSFEYNLPTNTYSTVQELNISLHKRLTEMFNKLSYDTWFIDTYICKVTNNYTYISCSSNFVMKFVEEHYEEKLQEIIREITGEQSKIKFVLRE